MFATDLMTLVPLIGMTLLRLAVPILAMGLLCAALKRIAPEASENDRVGMHHALAANCTAPQPSKNDRVGAHHMFAIDCIAPQLSE